MDHDRRRGAATPGTEREGPDGGVALARTKAPLTLWVDAARGSDRNDGTARRPLKTIEAAVDRVPFLIRVGHPVTINVKAGTYRPAAGALAVTRACEDSFTIQGVDWLAPPLLEGPTAGSFSSARENDAVASGAAWKGHALKGKFVRMTSGPFAGKRFPIADNSATSVTLAMGTAAGFAGEGFTLEEPGAVLLGDPARSATLTLNSVGMVIPIRTPETSHALVTISGFRIGSGANYSAYVASASPGGDRFLECVFVGTPTSLGVCLVSAGTSTLERCFLSTGRYLVTAGRSETLAKLKGAVLTDADTGLLVQNGATVVVDDRYESLFCDLSRDGIEVLGCTVFSCNRFRIERCGVGLRLEGFISLEADGLEILDSAEDGILIGDADHNFDHDVHLGLGGVAIRGSGGDGIRMAARSSSVCLGGPGQRSVISGNRGYGVHLPAGLHVTQELLLVSSALEMSGNAKGDLCLDGATARSLADLRAAPDGKLADEVRGNVAFSEGVAAPRARPRRPRWAPVEHVGDPAS